MRSSKLFLGALFSVVLLSFGCRNKVTISRIYIYSTSWEKGGYQGFRIAKIKLLDSSVSVFDKNFNKYFLDKHIIDSNFCYGVVSKNEIRQRKDRVYFNRTNENLQWFKCSNGFDRIDEIGQLDYNTWYIITGLYGTEDFYVYIDKEGESHVYSLGPTNW